MPGTFYLYVANADIIYARALECGAKSICAPADRSYGDRNGSVKDVSGNTWYIATHLTE
jgi:PhnB protein